MTAKLSSLFFLFLGMLTLVIVLILSIIRGVPIFLDEERLVSHGMWSAFVFSLVITGAMGVLSVITGLSLQKARRVGRYSGIVTSAFTTLIGLIGTFTEIIPVLAQIGTAYPYFRYFYIILLIISLIMWLSIAISWRESAKRIT